MSYTITVSTSILDTTTCKIMHVISNVYDNVSKNQVGDCWRENFFHQYEAITFKDNVGEVVMHAKLKTTESYQCLDNCRIINILLGFTCYQCYFTFMVTYNKSNTSLLSIKKQHAIYIQKIHTKWGRFPTSCFWCGIVALHFVHLKIATNRIAPSKDL